MKKTQSNLAAQAGVTLIELIVVIAIFALVSSVIMFNYSSFSTNVSIRNLSQEMALAIRKAQTYATSVRNIDASQSSTNTFPAYGMSFTVGSAAGSNTPGTKQFILFADVPPSGLTTTDGVYTAGSGCGTPSFGNECVEKFTITGSDQIVSLTTDLSPVPITTGTVNIIFRRPSPEANICVINGASCNVLVPSYVKVTIQSVKGLQKTITVWNTGQISAS